MKAEAVQKLVDSCVRFHAQDDGGGRRGLYVGVAGSEINVYFPVFEHEARKAVESIVEFVAKEIKAA